MSRSRTVRTGAAGVACLAVIAAPLFVSNYLLTLLTLVFIAGLLAASVNYLAGEAGLVSMGQAGIAAAAAYGLAYATVRGHDVLTQLGLALAVALVVSAVFALATMRSRGIVFLMITLALGMIVYGLASKLVSFTGGQNGLTDIVRPALIAEGWRFYLFSAAAFVLGALVLRRVSRAPFGLALRGVRESESRMSSLGYRVAAIKFGAVMIAGLVAGLAGVLAVWQTEFISPSVGQFSRSALAVIMVILGGTGTLLGPLVGAAIVIGAEYWLSTYVERWATVLGVVFIVVVLFARRGIVGELEARFRRGRGQGGRSDGRGLVPITVEAVDAASAGPLGTSGER
jgi:branched-chain amino acid transport system permease protein